MVLTTAAAGARVNIMVGVASEAVIMPSMMGSLRTANTTASGPFFGLMAPLIRGSGAIAEKMDGASSSASMELFTRVSGKMVSSMVRANCQQMKENHMQGHINKADSKDESSAFTG